LIESHSIDNPETIKIYTNNIIVLDFIFSYMLLFQRNIEVYLEDKLLNNQSGIVSVHKYLSVAEERDAIFKIYNFEKQLKAYYDVLGHANPDDSQFEYYTRQKDKVLAQYKDFIDNKLTDEQVDLYVNKGFF
jgi:hypothetical protein